MLLRSALTATAVLLAAFVGSGAHAQSAPVLYGLADASVARVKPLGGDGRWQLDSGSMTRSYIGFRATEDLGGGLRAVLKLESYVRTDTGEAGRSRGDAFWSRGANVGLSGAFGTTVLGRTVTPLYLATINYNPFGESLGFSPSARQWFGGAVIGDESWNNSVAYTNEGTGAPLLVNFAVNLLEDTPGQGRNVGLSAAYTSGPFSVVLVGERIKNSPLPLPAGFSSQKAYQIGATYDFKFARLYAQLGRLSTNAPLQPRAMLLQLGASVPLGNGLILVAYGRSQQRTTYSQITDHTTSLGYDYFLSKHTDIYLAALYEKSFNVSAGHAIAGGVRMRF